MTRHPWSATSESLSSAPYSSAGGALAMEASGACLAAASLRTCSVHSLLAALGVEDACGAFLGGVPG
eukprot:10264304-Alexandrium_andersonii.AAC.1